MGMRFKVNDPTKAKEYFEDKLAFTTGPVDLKEMLDQTEKPDIFDVREAKDYDEGHIPGAINVPEDEWKDFKGFKKDKINLLYCYSQTCHLAARAAVFFASQGYPVMELEGGFESWKEHDYDIEKKKPGEEAKKVA